MKTYTVVIIGCGSIGALKPKHIDYPESENILTHANAVCRHPQTELIAIIDENKEQLSKAKDKWFKNESPLRQSSKCFLGIESFRKAMCNYDKNGPDIVIVAVPTRQHYNLLLGLFDPGSVPKLIIAEKPFCMNFTQAQTISTIYKEKKLPILVDYIRRFAPGYKEIKRQIDSGVFGKAQNARVLYGRGLRREGCHAIDLMRYFFGECWDSYIELRDIGVNERRYIIDRSKDDPSVYANFEFEKCPNVVFQPCDGRNYGIFEIDICFEKGRLRFIDNGLYVEKYPVVEENEWGHKSLGYKLTSIIRQETGLNVALYNLIDNAVKFLDEEEDLICTAEDAVKVHKIIEGLK